MPKVYENNSPATKFLNRTDQLLRLGDRVLDHMRNATDAEYEEVRNTVIDRNTNSTKFVRATMERITKSRSRFADFELMLQLFFCRHIDNFQIFLEELIGDAARRNPELLESVKLRKADEALPAAERLERRLRRLSFMSFGDFDETLAAAMGFKLFPDDAVGTRIRYFFDIRNLITHRYGTADQYFVQRYPWCGVAVGSTFVVTMELTRDALSDLGKAAADIQRRAEDRFGSLYETKVVGQTEWWEEPDTPLPDLPPPSNRQ